MIGRAYTTEMARYNAWQNGVVYGLCEDLGEAERTRDRGLFFASLHRTLDHIALVDTYILDLLETGSADRFDPKATLHATWPALRTARTALDGRIAGLARHDDAWFAEVLEFMSTTLGRVRRIPRSLYVMQMFNHQTHHRSQVTAALWSMGLDYGTTDLPFRPDSPY